ncbi:hypothetical protein A0128_21645 [Leptospira tipperaryensis]|uniref:Uncharacterized protein n=1 Tax=Leptospira tipperaryensis TaxID=2564040 RepID=A0A1D7V484_9LEPT|nr:hypothetical protein A0128_21645 [Leptospira tipperaryensis]
MDRTEHGFLCVIEFTIPKRRVGFLKKLIRFGINQQQGEWRIIDPNFVFGFRAEKFTTGICAVEQVNFLPESCRNSNVLPREKDLQKVCFSDREKFPRFSLKARLHHPMRVGATVLRGIVGT